MSFQAGARLGAYEVVSLLGSGGMGEVYRARDTKLNRDVAIKVLPERVASDPERLARFHREAQVLASLNHPNIAAIYGFEDATGVHALVMELVGGATLADRIARAPLPLNEALPMAKQIAEALEAAHEQGIIHRDLKPANVKVREDGTVKVLDFGLAKLAAAQSSGADMAALSDSPTLTTPAMTEAGVILGTAAYMAPEQARGKVVDKRADIWAFGCVLFEMLSGTRVFEGDGLTDTLATILMKEPDWAALPSAVPPSVRRLLQRCLDKDPKRRLRDIGEARVELDEGATQRPAPPAPTVSADRRPSRSYVGLAAVVALLLVGGGAAIPTLFRAREAPSLRPVTRTTIALPADQKLVSGDGTYSLAVSLDGSTLAYIGERDGQPELYVRAFSALEPKLIPGTTGAAQPFFSPDGQWVGFVADGALQKAAVSGGAPLRICKVPGATLGSTWGPDDTIVVAVRGAGWASLFRINAAGGVLEPIAGASPASWPEILPDGQTLLYTTGEGGNSNAIATLSLKSGAKRIVARTADASVPGPAVLGTGGGIAQARFVSSGYLVYAQSPGIVRALPFDLISLSATGSPTFLVDSVERARNGGGVYFAVSRTGGLLVYAVTGDRHQLVWVDRNGAATPISADRAAFREPRVSPDGTRIAVAINDETRRSDIWIYDGERGTKNRLTTEHHNLEPVWSPDGTRIAFSGGTLGLVELPTSGIGAPETLLSLPQSRSHLAAGTTAYPTSWSPDGRDLLFQADELDLWVLSRGADGGPRPLLVRPSKDAHGSFSPDGRWVAYSSDESGRSEVYVGRYPALDNQVTISTEGGTYPRWARDGHELFYRQGDALMAVTVTTTPAFHAEKPRRLFSGAFSGTGRDADFDVAPGGQRFVMVKSDDAATLRQLTVVQNWAEELKRLAPPR